MRILWEWVFGGAPVPLCTSCCQAAGSHHDYVLVSFKATTEFGGKVWGEGKLKCHNAYCFYWNSAVITDSVMPLVNF